MYGILAPDVSRKGGNHRGRNPHMYEQKAYCNHQNHNAKLPWLEIEWRYLVERRRKDDNLKPWICLLLYDPESPQVAGMNRAE
jgi:hypothetical protein